MDSVTFTEKPIFVDPTNIDEQLREIADQYSINQSMCNILMKQYERIKKIKDSKK